MSSLLRKSCMFDSAKFSVLNPKDEMLERLKNTLSRLGFEVNCVAKVQTVYEVTISRPTMKETVFKLKDGIAVSDIVTIYSQLGMLNDDCREELEKEVDRLVREVL